MANGNDPSKNRKFIRPRLESIYPSGGTLDEVIDELAELRKAYAGKGWDALRLEIDAYDDDYDVKIIGERWETDAEMAERIAKEEQEEREQYERLKARFEKA